MKSYILGYLCQGLFILSLSIVFATFAAALLRDVYIQKNMHCVEYLPVPAYPGARLECTKWVKNV